jgi:NADH-quinone oxidoreductase subunit H
MMDIFFKLTIFPGFLFVFFMSFLFEWFMRKFDALMQNRIGPAFYQPFVDFIKLLSKETIILKKSKFITTICVFSFVSVALLTPFIPMFGQQAIFSGPGDFFVVFELFALISVAFILIGIYSKSSFGFFGAVRESILLIVYEILLLFFLLVIGIYSGWSITSIGNPLILKLPFLTIAFIIFAQCETALTPFNISEADQEIVSGFSVEFSGYRFALFYLTKIMRVFLVIAFIVTTFLGGGGFFIYLIKALAILFLMAIIQVITCRIRIDQAFKVSLAILLPLTIVDFIRVMMGIV